MIKTIRQVTLRGATGAYRTATFENRDYVVVNVIALVEGVIQAMGASAPELVTAETFSVAPAGWNGRPVVHNHPVVDGAPVSANSPSVLEAFCFGKIFNTAVQGKQLHMEGWIDLAKASAVGGEMQKTVDRILDGKPVEVSVGVFVTAEEKKGSYNGIEYEFIWREIVPDHLAFLEEGHIGACSNTMGCGVRAAAVHTVTTEGIELPVVASPRRSLRERLQAILPLRFNAKGYSDSDVREALRDTLGQQEPLFAYIESVYESDGYLIYCTMAPPMSQQYEEHYYKRSFTLDKSTGVVTLGSDRTEVEPKVKFEPLEAELEGQPRAACACQHNNAPQPSEEDHEMTRTERIQALLNNANCPIKEQPALEALTDAGLTALEQSIVAPAPVVEPVAPVVAPVIAEPVVEQAPLNAEQWMAAAPASIRDMVARHQAQDAAKKAALVSQLKTAQQTYTEVELNTMTIEQLEKTAQLIKIEAPVVDYSAQHVRVAAAAVQDYTPPDPYALKKN